MMLPLGFLLGGFAGVARCSPSASVLSFEVTSAPSIREAPEVDYNTATLILSKRLGLSHHYPLQGLGDAVLGQIGEFGGGQQPLLKDGDESPSSSEVLIFVDGAENVDDVFTFSDRSLSFNMSDALSSSESEDLSQSFAGQLSLDGKCVSSLELPGGISVKLSSSSQPSDTNHCCPELSELSDNRHLLSEDDTTNLENLLSKSLTSWCHQPTTAIIHISILQTVAQQEGTSSTTYKAAARRIAGALQHLSSHAKSDGQSSLVVLNSYNSRNAKRSSVSHQKLQSSKQKRTPSPPREALLGDDRPTVSSFAPQVLRAQPSASSTPAKKGLYIPLCHASLSACNAATNNCSGHGTCFRKYSLANPDDAADKTDCYSCGCSTSQEQGGKKTTHWGGAACQKKDVSAPFFLLAGLTIFLVGTVSWGVGLLFSIGQEELPGVIGAGVAGPRAQR